MDEEDVYVLVDTECVQLCDNCSVPFCKQIMCAWALNSSIAVIRLPVKTDLRMDKTIGRISLPFFLVSEQNPVRLFLPLMPMPLFHYNQQPPKP